MDRCFFLAKTDAAELLVVDQLGDGRSLSTDRAVRILHELHFPEFHIKRIIEKQPPHQRVAFSKDQLDGFSCLNESNRSGENTKHPALCAGRNHAGWRRFGVKAPVAGALFSPEYGGLTFKTEDTPINI